MKNKFWIKSVIVMVLFGFIFGVIPQENYSNGERVGYITQLSKTGTFFKTWEGHLNTSQTGMNSSVPFDFSVDRSNEPAGVVETLDSAAKYGWRVELIYHQVKLKNWFRNRGNTDYFVTNVKVLQRAQ